MMWKALGGVERWHESGQLSRDCVRNQTRDYLAQGQQMCFTSFARFD